MPETIPENPNIFDPNSPDYPYATRTSYEKYQKQIDSDYSVPDEHVKARKNLEQKAFDLIGNITDKYYQQIIQAIGDYQPSGAVAPGTSAPQPAATVSAAPTGARYVQGQPPGWRGIRGILRWLWYGKHADNPDYAPYEINPGEEQPQREWLSLRQYNQLHERTEIAADQIIERVMGGAPHQGDENIKQSLQKILGDFKQELITKALRPMLHQMWRTGIHSGIKMKGGESQQTSTSEPVSPSGPETSPRQSGTDPVPRSDSEEVSTSKPPTPPQRPDKETIEEPSKTGKEPSKTGKEPSKTKPTKKFKGRHAEISKIVDEQSDSKDRKSMGSNAYMNPSVISYLSNARTPTVRGNALRSLHKNFPLNWDDVSASLKELIENGIHQKPGGIVGASENAIELMNSMTPDEAAQKIKNEPMLPHLLKVQGALKSLTDRKGINQVILELKDKTTRQKRKSATQTSSGKETESSPETTTTKPKPRGTPKSRRVGRTKRRYTPEEARKAQEEARKAREKAAEEAEDRVSQASSPQSEPDEKSESEPPDTPADTPESETDLLKPPPKGASENVVRQYIKKVVDQSADKEDQDWIEKTKRDLWKILDSWIGDDNTRTDWIGDTVDEMAADFYAGGSFDDDMQSDIEAEELGGRDTEDRRANEALVHMIGRKWLESLTLDARKRYYKLLMKEGRKGPYVRRTIVDNMPLQERKSYYRELLKNKVI